MNGAFVCLVLALSASLILMVLIADFLGGPHVPIRTLERMNSASLVVFMGANLLTGLVNHLVATIHAPPLLALLILTAYAVAVVSVSWIAHFEEKNRLSR